MRGCGCERRRGRVQNYGMVVHMKMGGEVREGVEDDGKV